jgi:hypothetical protein
MQMRRFRSRHADDEGGRWLEHTLAAISGPVRCPMN